VPPKELAEAYLGALGTADLAGMTMCRAAIRSSGVSSSTSTTSKGACRPLDSLQSKWNQMHRRWLG
jgi:hypothetical protein